MMKFRQLEDGTLTYEHEPKKRHKNKKSRLEELADALEALTEYEDMSPFAKEEIISVVKELRSCFTRF